MPSLYTPVPVVSMALLMVVIELKHLLADYMLQSDWMAQGKVRERDWAMPLAAHAGLHGLGTVAVTLLAAPNLWWLGLVDFTIHGAIDRSKALAGQRWNFPVTDARFWWLMGIDQYLHHVTNIGLAVVLVLA